MYKKSELVKIIITFMSLIANNTIISKLTFLYNPNIQANKLSSCILINTETPIF